MLDDLIANNRRWAAAKTQVDPEFFKRLTSQQTPEYFWIGCSDSRVPANEIVNLDPGEMFVHRNVATLAPPQDANYLSVLQYAVHVLKVKHVLVVGHYGCGGVRTAVESQDHGLIDHWLAPIREVAHAHKHELDACGSEAEMLNALCEMNVRAQVRNITLNPITLAAWRAGHELTIHGWVYSLENGLVTDLGVSVSGLPDRQRVFEI
ncbi:MAG: carbonic anhydrase [Asticcacaulis sp.]